MTSFQLLFGIGIGILLATIYLLLLWLTARSLPKIKHKGLLLIGSAILRFSLFLIGTLYFSQKSTPLLLLIAATFIITRFVVIGCIKSGVKK